MIESRRIVVTRKKLARYYAAGLLTAVHIPDKALLAARTLVRRRVTLVEDLTRTKQRSVLLLQSRGYVYRGGQELDAEILAVAGRPRA